MNVVVSLAVLLTIATIATVRWAGHHLGHALLAFLAGLFVATTSAGPVLRNRSRPSRPPCCTPTTSPALALPVSSKKVSP